MLLRIALLNSNGRERGLLPRSTHGVSRGKLGVAEWADLRRSQPNSFVVTGVAAETVFEAYVTTYFCIYEVTS